MKNPTLFTCLFIVVLFSCKDDDANPTGNNQTTNFYPLTVGSYWVYDWTKIDTNGVETPFGGRDSIYISGDTMINSIKYAVIESSLFGGDYKKEYQRDSSGFLVNNKGQILFDPSNSQDLLWIDTIFQGNYPYILIEYSMEGTTTEIEVPSGKFECFNLQGKVITQDSNYRWGTRYKRDYYSDGIGKIQSINFFHSNPVDLRSELVKYHIE